MGTNATYIVVDNYGLPCSYPTPKPLAEKLADGLNKLPGNNNWSFYVKEVPGRADQMEH